MSKKIIAFIMALAVMISMAPASVYAEETATTGSSEPQSAGTLSTAENVTAKATGRGSVKVSWTLADGADGYIIYRSTKASSGFKKIKTTGSRTKSYKDKYKSVKVGRTYYYTVKAYAKTNGITVKSESSSSVKVKNSLSYKKKFRVKAYSYTGGGTTASGKCAKVGRIAVDPHVIKLGTWVYVQGYGIAQACDTGGNIHGKTVDLYQNSESACNRWGVRHPVVYVLK